jgi:anti-sigma B factor antagonist
VNFRVQSAPISDSACVIELAGEVDLYTAPELKHELLRVIDGGATFVVVDLTETTFIDSTTLGVLLGGLKRLRPLGGSLLLVCADRNIRKIFEITLLDRVFTIVETRDLALAELDTARS